MNEQYAQACSAYLAEYIKSETINQCTYHGWYHYIDSPEYRTVGAVATAQMLILIKDCNLNISFDCAPMLWSLLDMQNPDGGWSYRSNFSDSATEPTALAIQALLLWHESIPEKWIVPIEKAISWLLENMNSSYLWGPIGKKEKYGYTYFSCAVLRCLHRVLKFPEINIPPSLLLRAQSALNHGCNSLLKAFNNSDIQCGWGPAENKKATLFHTAYVIITLLDIDSEYAKKHPIIKSLALLSDYMESTSQEDRHRTLSDGIHEIYQNERNRLTYIHSVDVYITLALLYSHDPTNKQTIVENCKSYIALAEKTDWRYQDFVTAWRLYDIVLLCHKYTNLTEEMETVAGMQHFNIALTFAGESRGLVEEVAFLLSDKFGREKILYDKFHEAMFARPQLDLHLQKLYHDYSDLIVVFLCEQYEQKRWCGVEWRAIRDIINNFNYEKIMYVKACKEDIDKITLPGFYGSQDGYIDANTHTPREVANLIIERYNITFSNSSSSNSD